MTRNEGRITTVVLMGALAACGGGDGEQAAATGREPIVVAAAAPSPVVTPVVDSTPSQPRTDFSNVTYADAESVFRKGRYGDAAEMFAGYTTSHPENAFGHYMLGLSAWKSDDRGRAERALLRAVELDSGSVKARTNLGRVLIEQGRAADALTHLEVATTLAPDSHEVWRVLGNAQSELGRGEEALESYRQALVRNGRDAWSMNNYGLVLIRLGRYEEALPPLALAVTIVPGSPVFQNNLGIAFERSGDLPGAVQAFGAALAADSTYRKAQGNAERVQARLGDMIGEAPDIAALARSFGDEIELWRTSRVAHIH